jgi:hypothetical protein
MPAPPPSMPAQAPAGMRNHAFLDSRPIAVHRNVIHLAGNAAAGIFMSQLIYWTRHGVEVRQRDGWVRKTADQWQLETGMTWKVQKRARNHLVSIGLIEERRTGLPAQTEYRVNVNELAGRSAQLIHMHLDERMSLDMFRTDAQIVKQLLGRATAYHRRLAELVPHINDALLLSRIVQESGHSDRWVCRSRSDWMTELLMSRPEWETARRHLRQAGLLIERGCNYPRRVDFMVPAQALMLALAGLRSQKSSPSDTLKSSGLDRAKLMAWKAEGPVNAALGDIGRNSEDDFPLSPSPIPASPVPAYKAHPIEPIRIPQSRLYIREGLQVELQQQLHREAPPREPGVVAVETSNATNASEKQTLAFDNAVWPTWIAGFERVIVWTYLSNLPATTAQSILDEMDWSHHRKGVTSPPGLARTLSLLASKNEFVPEGAHRIQAKREQSMRLNAAITDASQPPPQAFRTVPTDARKGLPVPDHLRQKLALTRQALVLKVSSTGSHQ